MKLNHALLCLDCDEVHDDIKKCPSCGSAIHYQLSRSVRPMVEREDTALRRTETGIGCTEARVGDQ